MSMTTAAESGDPRVSVVIPAYNCEDYVAEAIDSVLRQTFKDYEIIVVNDASTDATPQILRAYERNGDIRVVTHEKNKGLAAARNSGIRAAHGRWITFLDADDVWRPEKLQYHQNILDRNPGLVFISNNGMRFNCGEEVVFPPLPEDPVLKRIKWKELLLGRGPFSGSNATVKRECFEEVGLFDESLRAAEDRDMWMRIARRFATFQAPGYVHGYRMHGGNMSADPTHMERNIKCVLVKARDRLPVSAFLYARSLAHMYLDLAIECYNGERRLPGLSYLVRSFLRWPLPLGKEVYRVSFTRFVWAVKLVLGRKRFDKGWPAVRELARRLLSIVHLQPTT